MSPYLRGGPSGGLTNRFVGDGAGLFGAGRPTGDDLFANWLTPGNLYLTGYGSNVSAPLSCQKGVQQSPLLPMSTCDSSLMSTIEFVGPNSPNPKHHLVPQSGRFGPALGFAWQVPWFGDGKTTMRGGFQRTYGTAGSTFSGGLLSGPGGDGTTQGITAGRGRYPGGLTAGSFTKDVSENGLARSQFRMCCHTDNRISAATLSS